MKELTLNITSMAHGGAAVGRDSTGRPVFVPYAIPGEKVRAEITAEKKNFARAVLKEVLEPSPRRTAAQCPHFETCGGCHLQHMAYEMQLEVKRDVVIDQLQRIGGFDRVNVRPTLANPSQWEYRTEISLSPVPNGGLGFWSPSRREVIPIDTCRIIQPQLLALWQDIDLSLPGLRKLTLRLGDDEAMLAALEVDDVEPPELNVDFPISVAIVMPDRTAASLIGDLFLIQSVKGRDFRVSPGCFFHPSPTAAALLTDVVLEYTRPATGEAILEAYSGVGVLTAFLAEQAGSIVGIEVNPDAVEDASVNLNEFDNVTLYQGWVEEVLPILEDRPSTMVVNPPAEGFTPAAGRALINSRPNRLVYVSSDVATLARDGKHLKRAGFKLVEVQPIDMEPQTFRVETVSLWQR